MFFAHRGLLVLILQLQYFAFVCPQELGTLPSNWLHGSAQCSNNNDPPLQIHEYNENMFILRANKCVHYEAPFIYLLFGEETVFMQDTTATTVQIPQHYLSGVCMSRSATTMPIRDAVEQIISLWAQSRNRTRESLELVVTHSHAHGDHIAGDPQFMAQPLTSLISPNVPAIVNFFNIPNWPVSQVTFDLGNRILDIIPIPGHETTHIAVYDRQTTILLTGDSFYAGRLYVPRSQWMTFKDSIKRLMRFSSTVPISHVLGTHIEMTRTPGVDYPVGTTYQPNEHVLELTYADLLLLDVRLDALGNTPSRDTQASFIIYPTGFEESG